jgi:electron transfer flavoprotein-quinone oxidoreductase
MAAEAILKAFRLDNYSEAGLRSYGKTIAESFVVKDLKKYRRLGRFLYHHKEIFTKLPELVSYGAREIITVNGVSKKNKEKSILAKIRKEMPIPRIVRLIWQAWRATR